jgi:DNA-binding IclR family transcriptional regulator
MEAASPPTDRVLRILQLLASRPHDAFWLSDLVRHLGLTRATGHAIVSTLAENGYLLRHPQTKTFSLGPALVSLGRAADQAFPEIVHAFAEIEKLARVRGAVCSISAIIDGEIVILGTAGGVIGERAGPRVGQRIPFVPPYGSSFLAMGADDDLEDWLSASPPGTSAEELSHHRLRVESIRESGYGIEHLTDTQSRLRQILVEIQADPLASDLEAQVSQLAQSLQKRVGDELEIESRLTSEIFAPVEATGLTLSLHFRERPLTADEIHQHTVLLLDACRRISLARTKEAPTA